MLVYSIFGEVLRYTLFLHHVFAALGQIVSGRLLTGCLAAGTLRRSSLIVQRTNVADGGLQELHTDTVLAGLNDHGAVGDGNDAP